MVSQIEKLEIQIRSLVKMRLMCDPQSQQSFYLSGVIVGLEERIERLKKSDAISTEVRRQIYLHEEYSNAEVIDNKQLYAIEYCVCVMSQLIRDAGNDIPHDISDFISKH